LIATQLNVPSFAEDPHPAGVGMTEDDELELAKQLSLADPFGDFT
jgi:hypothetical protein